MAHEEITLEKCTGLSQVRTWPFRFKVNFWDWVFLGGLNLILLTKKCVLKLKNVFFSKCVFSHLKRDIVSRKIERVLTLLTKIALKYGYHMN